MSAPNDAWWARARWARDQLIDQFLSYPDVSMVDIGEDPQGVHQAPVLRIHLRRASAAPPDLPGDVDGIPVRLVRGNYQLE